MVSYQQPASPISFTLDHRAAARAQAAAIAGIALTGGVMAVTSLRLPLLCPLRLMTGVPCPLCGMTTGTVAVIRGDLLAAARANPLSIAFVPSMVWAFFNRLKQARRPSPPIPWSTRKTRFAMAAGITLMLATWTFELFRFGIL